jgi:LDH2 family malate/lactate/ureidoglycolate dehydrogenase
MLQETRDHSVICCHLESKGVAMSTDQAPRSSSVRIDRLRSCVIDILGAMDHPDEHAAIIADVLIDADLRGYDDHGVGSLTVLLHFRDRGRYNSRAEVRILKETESNLLLDGDGGLGVVAAMQAMTWCVERARKSQGIACAAIRDAGWAVASAPYVELAAHAGTIGFTCTNTAAIMAPPGGRTPVVGSNPLAFGFPAGRHDPVIFDMATSGIAALKVRIAAMEGRALPEGLIADAAGRPTTDPRAFLSAEGRPIGTVLPLGWPRAAYKGFGLAMTVDLLAGVLSGSAFGRAATPVQSNVGQFYWALDVEAFMPLAEFKARIDAEIDEVKASARVEGGEEILVPGERGQRRRAKARERGLVDLDSWSWNELAKACAAVGVSPPSIER